MKSIKLSRIAKYGVKTSVVAIFDTPEYRALQDDADKRIEQEKDRMYRAFIQSQKIIAR